MNAVKAANGVPARLAGCHTALVEGYIVEGHVPADLVDRMLRERPPIAGLAVPGMPIGSPGMEVPGRAPEPYEVIAFDRDGGSSVYDRR
jgi:hypothetical protein